MADQPHIRTMGTFSPTHAFMMTFDRLASMINGLQQSPEAVPKDEIMRAAEHTLDLLDAISGIGTHLLMTTVAQLVGPEVYETHRLNYIYKRESRTREEAMEQWMNLVGEVSFVIPTELDISIPSQDDDTE